MVKPICIAMTYTLYSFFFLSSSCTGRVTSGSEMFAYAAGSCRIMWTGSHGFKHNGIPACEACRWGIHRLVMLRQFYFLCVLRRKLRCETLDGFISMLLLVFVILLTSVCVLICNMCVCVSVHWSISIESWQEYPATCHRINSHLNRHQLRLWTVNFIDR